MVWLTFPEFAYGQHAVAGREIPYTQGFVVTDRGTERQMGMSSQAPNLTLHVTLQMYRITLIFHQLKLVSVSLQVIQLEIVTKRTT